MPANKVSSEKSTQGQGKDFVGEPNQDLANGPMEKRSCRDVICCLIFIAFIGGMIGIAGYALKNGNPTVIGRGYDYDGNLCGYTSGYENYPYLYFAIPVSGYLTETICVKTCPSGTNPSFASGDCKTTTKTTSCTSTTSNVASVIQTALSNYISNPSSVSLSGALYLYDTTGFVNRFCIPSSVTTATITYATGATDTVANSQLLEEWIADIRQTWQVIACSFAVAALIGFVYMILLRYCSGVLTWVAIFCFIVGTAVLGWRFYQNATDTNSTTSTSSMQTSSNSSVTSTITTSKVVAYVCWAVSGLTVLLVLCLFNRIRLAIAIIKAAADYVKATPTVFLLVPANIFTLVCFLGYWGITAVYLVSSGDTTRLKDSAFGTFSFDTTLQRLLIYHLFGLLWLNAFFIAATQFVIASSAALWYFAQGSGQKAGGTIRKSIWRLIRYHFGSIAFGSLIIAIIQMIRIILAYIDKKAKQMGGNESKFIRFILKCLQCCMACFEKVIRYLNKNAYIQIALTGKSFCGAAKDAFFLILRNPLRFGMVAGIGGIFVFFGKIFVAALTALAGFLVITKWSTFSDGLYSPFIPTIVIFMFSYGIGAIFMNVYGLAADTILACFVVDEELSKQKNAPPRNCPTTLKSFIAKTSKKN